MATTIRNSSVESDFTGSPDYSSSNYTSSPNFEHTFDMTGDADDFLGHHDKFMPATPPHSDNDERATNLPTIPENEGDKPAKKKRKSWGQELPIPKTNLPPRKRAKTEDEKEQRRIERVHRNRKAAHASRERKRKEQEALEAEKHNVMDDNKRLKVNFENLSAKYKELEAMFETLKSCLPADSPFLRIELPQDKVVMKDLQLDIPPQPIPQPKEEIVVKSEPLMSTESNLDFDEFFRDVATDGANDTLISSVASLFDETNMELDFNKVNLVPAITADDDLSKDPSYWSFMNSSPMVDDIILDGLDFTDTTIGGQPFENYIDFELGNESMTSALI